MINKILSASGIPYRQGRFLNPPPTTYIILFDNHEVGGADPFVSADAPMVVRHDVTIELYEPKPDDEAEEAIEAALMSQGLPWNKESRYWLSDAQRYQVIYEFSYHEKRRKN